MNSPNNPNDARRKLEDSIREVRHRYDKLSRGETAGIRRAKTEKSLSLEGSYWRISAGGPTRLGHVVLHFPLLRHRATAQQFSFGRFLRQALGDSSGAQLRFRRVLDSRNYEELDHRLRGLLRLASTDAASVDWGVLGADICWFFAQSDNVRRKWAQDFYAPTASAHEPPASGASTNHSGDSK